MTRNYVCCFCEEYLDTGASGHGYRVMVASFPFDDPGQTFWAHESCTRERIRALNNTPGKA
jgi:hypothetical protein